MPADDSLKRLGGGRWETRDGRFAIEPQSGTWAVVDNSETDELGLTLVRGPFKSLTAAKEAIERARASGPAESPLKGRIGPVEGGTATERQARAAGPGDKGARRKVAARPPGVPKPPAPPPEPKWLLDLPPAERRRARELVERLEKAGIDKAVEIARAEIATNEPAVARLAIERRLREVIASAKGPDDAVRSAFRALSSGRDRDLDVRWRLVDERDRPLGDLDIDDEE